MEIDLGLGDVQEAPRLALVRARASALDSTQRANLRGASCTFLSPRYDLHPNTDPYDKTVYAKAAEKPQAHDRVPRVDA